MSIAYWLIAAAGLVLALIGLRRLRRRPLHWFGLSIDAEALVEELTMHLPHSAPDGVERIELEPASPAVLSWWRRHG